MSENVPIKLFVVFITSTLSPFHERRRPKKDQKNGLLSRFTKIRRGLLGVFFKNTVKNTIFKKGKHLKNNIFKLFFGFIK